MTCFLTGGPGPLTSALGNAMNNALLAKPVPFSPGLTALLQAGTDPRLRPEPDNLSLRSGAASSGLKLPE